MRFLVLSDIHANWHALEAVLRDSKGEFDQIVCCGDLVGYNTDPGKVIDWAKASCSSLIRGNHDKVVAGIDDLEWFNQIAQVAARWTISQLDEDQIQFLRELPEGPVTIDSFGLCHGSPRDEDEYVTSPREAIPCFPHLELPLTFFGHTHVQGGFFSRHSRVGSLPTVRATENELTVELQPDTIFLVNPGSVGQPRDGDPRAAYAIYNTERRTVVLRRIEYPVNRTLDEIRKAGLPDVLGQRLFCGL